MRNLNKKGFTLVELLAVIVILALIMAIAVYSISGILSSSRESVFKDTAISVIRGVKNQLRILQQEETGTYFFDKELLENNNDLPFGGKINYVAKSANPDANGLYSVSNAPSGTTNLKVKQVSSSGGKVVLWKSNASAPLTTCDGTKASFVNVKFDGGAYVYSVCLTSSAATDAETGARYIAGDETALMGNTVQTIYVLSEVPSHAMPN